MLNEHRSFILFFLVFLALGIPHNFLILKVKEQYFPNIFNCSLLQWELPIMI